MPNVNHKYVLNNGVVVGVAGRNLSYSPSGSSHYCRTSMRDALNDTGSIHYGTCAFIIVDINGRSKPNLAGRDTFAFRVYTDGVLPYGHIEANSNDGFSQCFSNSAQDNHNCTAWVIYHENMDYLRCRDKLNYDHGPYSCKEVAE